jgi:hypothetical protein
VDDQDRSDQPLLDFAVPLARLRRLLPAIAVLAVLGAAVEAMGAGLSAALVLRWATVVGVVAVAALAVLTAVHALGGADRAQRRGERLAGQDVRLLPARRRRDRD